MNSVPIEDRAPVKESNLHKTLGILWNVETDKLHFPLDFDWSNRTRRGVLSILAKVYDPFGVISLLLHQARLLLHQMCYEKYEWDDPMSGEMLKKYEKWCSNLDQIGEVPVSRWVRMCKMVSTLEMHHFADASSFEYATCSYLRILYEDGDIDVTFMLGKCRFVPFKPVLSIPRLELIAAVLSVQLATKLRKELPQRYTEYFWTDSTVVLGYIKNTAARFKIFVANRVQKIHDGSSPEEWFHIDSAKNPSDDGSRAVWSARWLKGPDFLKIPELITEHINSAVAPDDVEVKCLSSFGDEHQVAVQVNTFRNWFSTLKLWAWILRFTDNCRGIKRKANLRVEELEKSKINIIRMVQMLHLRRS
ncbi:hypothetical protein Pcinc_005139 [Petrolisthes cinctipes]|uniref:Uncharacterized protein n=1 Tax=Petrolisthes cinctipes TaxID=88211 RepID=A0AAE1GFR9_PETCI|nr:hypothetical protein Pcinc_005139 [Petrolisthes cinctipes]